MTALTASQDTDTPTPRTAHEHFQAQSLAAGTAGVALLAIERAHHGTGTWAQAHTRVAECARDLIANENASLYFGAPAVAFALHTAHTATGHYSTALAALDEQIGRLTRARLASAHARIDRGQRPRTGEFDLLYGLTGLGAYLLSRNTDNTLLRDILIYQVRLVWPLEGDRDQLPGWWTDLAPTGTASPKFPGGHGNLGMAHGIAGVLSLLAITAREGTIVDGQITAIRRICGWLDTWQQQAPTGPWWPQWITVAEHRTGTVRQPGPLRPSWCYGTPGLARAQQLAGIALGDCDRQRMAEHALLACLDDPAQLSRIRDTGVCHGAAGLLHTTHRVGREALITGFPDRLPRLRALLDAQPAAGEEGFLDGQAGTALVLAARNGVTASGWDACLLAG